MKKYLSVLATVFLLFVSNVYAKTSAPVLQCGLLPPIMQVYLAQHYLYHKLDSELENRTIEQFITAKLDPSKSYLLQSDVDSIQKMLKGILTKAGHDCDPIFEAHKVYLKRLLEVSDFVKKTLTPDFKFSENTEVMLDAKNRKWATNEKELHDQIVKILQFQLSTLIATDLKLEEAKKQLIHRYELNAKRQEETTSDDVYTMFLDAFATSLDAHSGYLSQDSLEDFEISMNLSLEGIGAALIWEDGYTTVDQLIPGGSAEKSGEIKPKDKIVAVAQGDGKFESVIDMPLRDVVKLIRGKKGTSVRLTLLRPGGKETSHLIVKLKRDKINLEDEAARLVYSKQKVGDRTLKLAIIDLPSFYGDLQHPGSRSCYEDVRKYVAQARRDKADGLILDLSRNGGGLLSEAVRIAGLFIKKGNIVATQDSKQNLEKLPDEEDAVNWTGPLVVLTSRLSASASEIVSGALQDYHRAVIVGADHTFGKGTVQAMLNLHSDLGAIKVTTGMFFVPGGNSTQQRGVPADVVLPSVFSTKDIGEAALDYSLPPRSVSPFLSNEANTDASDEHWSPLDPSLVQKLKMLSMARVEKDPEFKKIKEEVAETERDKGAINIAKSLKKQKEEKEKDKDKDSLAKNKRRRNDEDYLKVPQVNEAVHVLADMVQLTQTEAHASR